MMSSPTILIVEGNPVTRKMVRVALESERYTVLEAGDGQTALDLMVQYCPDLVLQDLVLPDIDGFELVQRLRSLPEAAETPILAVSGLLSPLEQARSLQAGFTDYLCKPVEPSHLVGTIRAYLLPAGTTPEKPGRGRRIVAADDDPIQLKLLMIHLERMGFQVATAADGAEALDLARSLTQGVPGGRPPPDAIVSDVLMPRLDGFQLCRAVRRDPELALVPVVLTSASYSEAEDQRLAQTVGANALVLRTPTLQDVSEALLAILSEEASVLPARPGEELSPEYTRRVVRQLERQVGLNTRLSDRLAWLEAKFAILTGIAETLKHSSALETVVEALLHHCLNAAGAPRGIAYLLQPEGHLSLRAQLGYSGAAEAELPEFFGHAHWLHSVMAAGEPVSGPSPGVPEDLLAKAAARSMLITPLVLGAERLGALVMAATSRDLGEEWVPFARVVGSQIGQAIGLARAFCQLKENEEKQRWFHREVIRAVTHDRLHLVDADDITVEGCSVVDLPCEVPTDCRALREQLRAITERVGMRPEVAEDLILAAAEGATNAIKHAVAGRCSVYVASNRVIARVSDRGHGIRPEDLPASLLLPGYSTQLSLGMGFTLMLKLVERIWLATGPGGTVVQLEKWLDPEEHLAARLLAAYER
jgi:CheY-like chemotaxis protein/anti-sigma regulatory factor (Ser/Thr protein kinase)